MELVVIIVLIIVAYAIWDNYWVKYRMSKRYGSKTTNSTTTYNSKPKSVTQVSKSANTIELVGHEEKYLARFENGTVYAISKYTGEYIIGYYALEDGEWKVRCQSDRGEIGRISKSDTSALIYFNRLGDLARYKNILKKIGEANAWMTEEEQTRQYNNAARKTELTWLCAEASSGYIWDMKTQDTLAISNSQDVIGNAAAFICLQYEVVMDGKYHSFFKAIN